MQTVYVREPITMQQINYGGAHWTEISIGQVLVILFACTASDVGDVFTQCESTVVERGFGGHERSLSKAVEVQERFNPEKVHIDKKYVVFGDIAFIIVNPQRVYVDQKVNS